MVAIHFPETSIAPLQDRYCLFYLESDFEQTRAYFLLLWSIQTRAFYARQKEFTVQRIGPTRSSHP